MKTVRQLLSAKDAQVFSISPDAKVLDALKLMAEKEVGALVVLDERRLVGILSERDYARKVILRGKSSHDIPVREIMTSDVLTVHSASTVEECMALVTTRRCRHLPVCDDSQVVGIVSIGDLVKEVIAEQEQTIKQLACVASHDALTGLFNRSMFAERLQQALAQADRHERKLAVLFIDLDGFKRINDMQGHDAGDAILCKLAKRLQKSTREGDTLGRMGGDEFVVLIESYQDETQLLEVARKVLETVAQPFRFRGTTHHVTASIGIATYPQDGREAQQLMKNADTAMYDAKRQGKNQFRFHSSADELTSREPVASNYSNDSCQ
jgi:diguanylate cyclase (GGDEF)-like protein